MDRINVGAGLAHAAKLGYSDWKAQMVVDYVLLRWKRGEEEGARMSWLSEYPNDLSSFYVIIAVANGAAEKEARNQ